MVVQLFLINLKTALQQKKKLFYVPYNEEVLKLLPELMNLNLIINIKKNKLKELKRLIIYLPNHIKDSSIKIDNMCSRKKLRTWTTKILIKKAQRNETYLLKTPRGYQNSHFCIRQKIGGKTILKIGF